MGSLCGLGLRQPPGAKRGMISRPARASVSGSSAATCPQVSDDQDRPTGLRSM